MYLWVYLGPAAILRVVPVNDSIVCNEWWMNERMMNRYILMVKLYVLYDKLLNPDD